MGKTEQRALCFQVAQGGDCEQEEISRTPEHSPWGSSRRGNYTQERRSWGGGVQIYKMRLPFRNQTGSHQETDGTLK